MLCLDPKKRATIEQIKKHRWMLAGRETKLHLHKKSIIPHETPEVQEQILKLMQNLGIDSNKTRQSLQRKTYDNLMAIYLLLIDRWQTSSAYSDSHTASRRQSEIPYPKVLLNSLRYHTSFQTTDCASSPSSTSATAANPTTVHTDVNERRLCHQSTSSTVTSVDEGVEADLSSSSASQFAAHCSIDAVANDCTSGSGSIASSPFESFDSQIETDVMSSMSSCHPNSEGSNNSSDLLPLNSSSTVSARSPMSPTHSEASPCASPQPTTFGDGWRASDNSMLDSLRTPFPIGLLGEKEKNYLAVARIDMQMEKMQLISSRMVTDKKTLPVAHPKLAVLREHPRQHFKFQPSRLLNTKQSPFVETKVTEQAENCAVESKNMYKARRRQKQIKTRILLRQQSYQATPKHGLISPNCSGLHTEEFQSVPLSPIEDLRSFDEDSMDTA
ncbi:hypothetical protein AB6A40_003505 [Gnathostoma spinigerum]|uniref:UBA domain-containing protein n=1 Tax=Gnathostoma spinigerum TaxID=75299 RepID=A0ABD6EHD2_9BILA